MTHEWTIAMTAGVVTITIPTAAWRRDITGAFPPEIARSIARDLLDAADKAEKLLGWAEQ